ncbi:MAG: hypothetical protein ACYC1T_06190 [Sulfuricaulis sp.]
MAHGNGKSCKAGGILVSYRYFFTRNPQQQKEFNRQDAKNAKFLSFKIAFLGGLGVWMRAIPGAPSFAPGKIVAVQNH